MHGVLHNGIDPLNYVLKACLLCTLYLPDLEIMDFLYYLLLPEENLLNPNENILFSLPMQIIIILLIVNILQCKFIQNHILRYIYVYILLK